MTERTAAPGESATQPHDPTTMRAHARVGRVLREKWTLDRLLGIGGMAAVYAATNARIGKRAAIKILHPELSADPQIRERFQREGRAANNVGHPGAVAVADDDVAEDGSVFLVMDLLEGESVENRRERAGGKLDVLDVLSISDQVLDVLAAAHAKGIVHRDLKPDNLFICRDGQVKVLDFGIARLREGASTKGTHTGISMGTPSYMAQEQARALWNEVDARTDLWAVGATMFACLTGRVVHDGRTMNEQLLSAMTKQAPFIRSIEPSVPTPLATVIDTALAFDRDNRYPDARSMQLAIRAAYEMMQSAPISTAPRLVVPDVAMQKTIPSASAIAALEDAPTADGAPPGWPLGPGGTGQPVVAGRTGAPLHQQKRRAPLVAVGIVGALAALGLGSFMALRTDPEKPVGTSPAAPPPASSVAPPAASSVAAPPPSPPTIPADALPPAPTKPDKTKKGPSPVGKPLTPADTPPPSRKAGPLDDKL